jgi:hypothetical protein
MEVFDDTGRIRILWDPQSERPGDAAVWEVAIASAYPRGAYGYVRLTQAVPSSPWRVTAATEPLGQLVPDGEPPLSKAMAKDVYLALRRAALRVEP